MNVLPLLILALTVYQGVELGGNVSSAFIQDCVLNNVTVSDAIVTNSTGSVSVFGKAVIDVFRGELRAVNAVINVSRSELKLFCVNSTVYAIHNVFTDVYLDNCTLKASLNEFRNVSVNVAARLENLPVMYSYGNRTFWKYAGNYWTSVDVSRLRDADGDGLADSFVCPNVTFLPSATEPIGCEQVLVAPPYLYGFLDLRGPPPLSTYEVTKNGLVPVEEKAEKTAKEPEERAALIASVVAASLFAFLLSLFVLFLVKRLGEVRTGGERRVG